MLWPAAKASSAITDSVFSGRSAWRTAPLVLLCAVAGVASGLITATAHPLAGFILLLGVVLAIVASLSRQHLAVMSVVVVAYLLPFGVAPVPLGGFHLTFLDIAITGALFVWMLRIFVTREDHLVITPLGGPVLVFVGLAITALLLGLSSLSGESLRLFLKGTNSMLFYFTVINTVKDRDHIKQLVIVVLAAASLQAALAVILYFIPPDTAARALNSLSKLGYPSGSDVLRYIASAQTLRAIGTSVDPNILGGTLLLVAPLVASLLLSNQRLLPRPLLLLMGALVLLALLLTYSRSAWLGATVGILFVGSFRNRKVWLLLALVAAVMLLSPFGAPFVERLQSGVTFQDRAAQMRLAEYRDAIKLISEYPWFGVGFGGAPRNDLYVATSSIYLLIASRMGLVGLSAFLLVVAVFLAYNLRRIQRRTDAWLDSVHLGAAGGVIGALVTGAFDHYFFNLQFPHTVALLWLFIGLTMLSRQWLEAGAEARRPPL